jgi:transcriptional regulator with XRE-family HTH domain
MAEEYTSTQYLEARKKYLCKMRKELNWTIKEISRKLKVMETEYINFENGLTNDLLDFEWEDIQFFLENHLRELESK